MSLRFQPDRNIILCGLPGSGVTQIAREVAVRTRRQFIDLRADAHRRETVARRWPLYARNRNGSPDFLRDVIELALKRSMQTLALEWEPGTDPKLFVSVRERGYVVFVDRPHPGDESGNGGDTDIQDLRSMLMNCDLYIGPDELRDDMYSQLVIHCFYS